MMRRIKLLIQALRSPDLFFLREAFVVLLIVDLAVRFRGFIPAWRLIQRQYRVRGPAARPAASEVRALVRSVRQAAEHHFYGLRCLPQSLALALLLARRGIPATLRLGVRKDNQELDAHAWLEWETVLGQGSYGASDRYQSFSQGGTTWRTCRRY